MKPAVTAAAEVRVSVHFPVPLHAPDQPANVDPEAAMAFSTTVVPVLKLCEQALPQLIPLGELATVPEPDPDFETLSRLGGGEAPTQARPVSYPQSSSGLVIVAPKALPALRVQET
ncbi:MAG TPA: hypothetical protein VJ716_02765 [Gaiellaceae bacterium]|nr:hypothetical protein [Gaiellaceae bacterium]